MQKEGCRQWELLPHTVGIKVVSLCWSGHERLFVTSKVAKLYSLWEEGEKFRDLPRVVLRIRKENAPI